MPEEAVINAHPAAFSAERGYKADCGGGFGFHDMIVVTLVCSI